MPSCVTTFLHHYTFGLEGRWKIKKPDVGAAGLVAEGRFTDLLGHALNLVPNQLNLGHHTEEFENRH